MSTREYRIVEGAYLRDILDQPRALRETLAHLNGMISLEGIARQLQERAFRQVVLTGMGSSLYGLYSLSLLLNNSGYTALLIETSELVNYLQALIVPDTLFIVVSQSGQSAEIIRFLGLNAQQAQVLAITNTADSPLAEQAEVTLLTHAGPEFSVSAKTYVTALLVIEVVGAVLCRHQVEEAFRDLYDAPDRLDTYLHGWREHVEQLAGTLGEVEHLFMVGRGRSLAAANTGALILKESAKCHAEGMSSAAFRHGPMEMLSKRTFVAVFEGDAGTKDLNYRLFDDLQGQSGRAEIIGRGSSHPALCLPDSAERIRPIMEIVPVQMMTLALNARNGVEAGRFAFVTKITTVE